MLHLEVFPHFFHGRINKCVRLLSETEPFTRTIALINVNGVAHLHYLLFLNNYWEIVVYEEI